MLSRRHARGLLVPLFLDLDSGPLRAAQAAGGWAEPSRTLACRVDEIFLFVVLVHFFAHVQGQGFFLPTHKGKVLGADGRWTRRGTESRV